MQIKYY